ncbi:MAG: hypothetical protein ACYSYW_10325 [Planctomycetota bacterium]|jgi:hypothetical protein
MLSEKGIFIIALALSICIACASMAQDREFLNQQVEMKFEQMREDGRQAFRGVLFYPADVRKAVLELSQYPELVAKLAFIKNRPLTSRSVVKPDDIIQDYPDEVKEAAKILNFYPDVLDIMEQNLVMTGLIGAVYTDDKAKILETVNRIAENTSSEHDESVDNWAQILEQEPELIEEMRAAQNDYTNQYQSPPASGYVDGPINQRTDYCDDYGYYMSDDGVPSVYGLPCYGYTSYVLYYPHRYPHLAHRIIHHYGRRYPRPVHPIARPPRPGGPDRPGIPAQLPEDSIDGFYDAVRNWQRENPEIVNEAFLAEDGKRVERLREYGQFQEQFRQEREKYSDLDRTSFLRRNPDKFPNLADMERAKMTRPQPSQRPSAGQRPAVGQLPTASQRPVAGQRPAVGQRPQPELGPRARQQQQARQQPGQLPAGSPPSRAEQWSGARTWNNVRREQMTRDQSMQRAQNYQRRSWQNQRQATTRRQMPRTPTPRTAPATRPTPAPRAAPRRR